MAVLAAYSRSAETTVTKLRTSTDSTGRYVLALPGAGRVLVSVVPKTEEPWFGGAACLAVEDNVGLEDVNFRLENGMGIVGLVNTDTSETIEGARIQAQIRSPQMPVRHSAQLIATESGEETGSKSGCLCRLSDLRTPAAGMKEAFTDKKGYFEIRGIPPGAEVTSLAASAQDCQPMKYQPIDPFSRMQEITLKSGSQVVLVVRDGATSRPVERFRYRFRTSWPWGTGRHSFMDWSEPDGSEKRGEAHVSGVPRGEWQIEVEDLNGSSRRADVVCNVKGPRDVVRIALGTKGVLHGVVLDPEGKPTAEARVTLLPYKKQAEPASPLLGIFGRKKEKTFGTAISGKDGSFEIPGCEPGTYELTGEKNFWRNESRIYVQVPDSGYPEPVVVQLTKLGTIYGKVIGKDGTGMADASLFFGEASWEMPAVRTKSDGSYLVQGVRPGYYKLGLLGYGGTMEAITIRAGEDREVNFDLSGLIRLSGALSVGGEQWSPGRFELFFRQREKGYPIYWQRDTGYFPTLVSNNAGRYECDLPPGAYNLWARYRDGRCLIAGSVTVMEDPGEQMKDYALQLVDVSVVVLDEESRPYDSGMVCFGQRAEGIIEPRVFSMNLKQRQSYFPDLLAGEYQVSFVSDDNNYDGKSEWTAVGQGLENSITIQVDKAKKGRVIGRWDPTNINLAETVHEYAAAEAIEEAGVYEAAVLYEWGANGVKIEQVSLFENGVEVARDIHPGWSGMGKRDHVYRLPLNEVRPGANYTVTVRMRADGGTMSQGSVTLRNSE